MLLAVAAILFVVIKMNESKEKFDQNVPDAKFQSDIGNNTFKPGFLPSHQGPWFEGMPPSLKVERTYHDYVKEDCGGDYGNYECKQKAYIKTLKDGTFDKADLICWAYRNNEDDYYKCLDGVYGNYIWMDRFTGAGPCHCPDGIQSGQGASRADGSCFCPPPRPLHDRRMLDEDYDIVKRS